MLDLEDFIYAHLESLRKPDEKVQSRVLLAGKRISLVWGEGVAVFFLEFGDLMEVECVASIFGKVSLCFVLVRRQKQSGFSKFQSSVTALKGTTFSGVTDHNPRASFAD